MKRAVLIAGPTASGKSALAMRLARERNGVIINADALQVYIGLSRITARPSAEDEAVLPHRLYGVVAPEARFSTGAYLRAATETIRALEPGLLPIIVGGTGLYFEALTKGFAEVPQVPPEVTRHVRALLENLDERARMEMLMTEDPETAGRLKVADPQRVERALAVKLATGRPLSSFHRAEVSVPLAGWELERLVLAPDRAVLRERIAQRFEDMMDDVGVAEVEKLLARELDPELPVMKAIGVREITAWRRGDITRQEAIARAVTATRQYAKRQETWFRNRMADWPRVSS